MKELIRERNPMNVRSVGKPTDIEVPFRDTKGFTREKPYECKLGKPSDTKFLNMKEITLERNHNA